MSGIARRTAGRARISVSWPLRATSRDTQTTTGRSPRPYRRRIGAAVDVGSERVDVDPWGELCEPRMAAERGHQASPEVFAEVGDDVTAGADPA